MSMDPFAGQGRQVKTSVHWYSLSSKCGLVLCGQGDCDCADASCVAHRWLRRHGLAKSFQVMMERSRSNRRSYMQTQPYDGVPKRLSEGQSILSVRPCLPEP